MQIAKRYPTIWYTAVRQWDELLVACLFIVFGVLSLTNPHTRSLRGQQETVPIVFKILFDLEFVLAGLLIIIGILVHSYTLRILAHILYCIGLFTVGGLILTFSHSYVAFICFAFAGHGVFMIRNLRRDQIARRSLNELINITKGTGS